MMPTTNDAPAEAIEAEARALLRNQLLQSAWYPNMSATKRRAQIEQDVERYWHLNTTETTRRVSVMCDVLPSLAPEPNSKPEAVFENLRRAIGIAGRGGQNG